MMIGISAVLLLLSVTQTALGLPSLPKRATSTDYDDALEYINIAAPDGSIKASYLRAGARVTNFYVKDKTGTFRDIVLGYTNPSLYLSDPTHPYFGPVVGRYANRIKNSTFTTPNGNTYHIGANDNKGLDTLHGGWIGYDLRVWTLSDQTSNSVSFSLYDPNGMEGFPGNVQATVTYTLGKNASYGISMRATTDQQTPIMLSSHTYWNLNAYNYTQDLSDHYIQLQADRYIETDSILIPTGVIAPVDGKPLDFRQPTQLGSAINSTAGTGLCGGGCTGFDNAFLYEAGSAQNETKMSLWSTGSGIRLDVKTNQIGAQVYTCNGVNARNITRKASQGGGEGSGKYYTDHSCIVLEQQAVIDGINNPQWGINQFYNTSDTYKWDATYSFSVMK